MVYYVIRGRGVAGAGPDRTEVRGGHIHLIPRGVERFLCNLSATEPLEVLAVYTGAGSLEEAGYVATGEVTDADLRARTGLGRERQRVPRAQSGLPPARP